MDNHGQQSVKCSHCAFKALCLPSGLDDASMEQLNSIIVRRRRVAKDEQLYRAGQAFGSMYAVHFGEFKTTQVNRRGALQVTGFLMAGELLGMDAIATGAHACDAVALEDSEVCEIPYSQLGPLIGRIPVLMQHFHRLMSQEILREQSVMLFLGNIRADQRMAMFLLSLGKRYAARGFSGSRYQLRMSREDIGAYLGLTIESVSRLLVKFRNNGWIKLQQREVELLDRTSLEALAAGVEADDIETSTPARTPVRKVKPIAPQPSRVIPIHAAVAA
ncbi:cyclic nucleotide-binding domain-containing protein [Massilia arenosa]|uniref:Cyclic nucleotide-binding domain-containing protein n=1 Tax=Zemynaea arenosa TaxID=2561931 RepID=A0A4Y9SKI9_9BURK|nr:helix-turn-helix domain-containing protein [Massilia arenosa]TFW23578.1 cyclic nucleotide-binding domain-containing protein [Massilia arenosa]